MKTFKGKISSSEPQIQRIPKKGAGRRLAARLKSVFVQAEFPGKDGIGADVTTVNYEELEPRVLAHEMTKKKRKPKPRRYSKGAQIRDLHELIDYLRYNTYVMWRDRPCHSSWVISMQLRTVDNLVKNGWFFQALDTKPKKGFFEKMHVSNHPQDDETHHCGHPDCAGFDPERA